MLQLLIFRKTQTAFSCILLVKYIIVPTSANFIINHHNILSNCDVTELKKKVKSKCPISHKTEIFLFTHMFCISYLIPSLTHLQGFWNFLTFFHFLSLSLGFLKSSLLSVVPHTVSCNWLLKYIKYITTENPLILYYWRLKKYFFHFLLY